MQSHTFGFHKMRGISRLDEDLLVSQQGFCSMELDINNKNVVTIRKYAVGLSLVMCDKTQNLCADSFWGEISELFKADDVLYCRMCNQRATD